MKYLMLFVFCIAAHAGHSARLNWNLTAAENEFFEEFEMENLNESNEKELRIAYRDFYDAEKKLHELIHLNALKHKNKIKQILSADVVDPTIRKIQEQARKYHNRFEVLKRTQNKWGPSTNLLARVARQSMQSRLDETRAERDQAKAEAKALKDMQKAARKFGKNIEKVRKDFEKYRDKAATEDERAFWQSLLDIIPVPNEAEK